MRSRVFFLCCMLGGFVAGPRRWRGSDWRRAGSQDLARSSLTNGSGSVGGCCGACMKRGGSAFHLAEARATAAPLSWPLGPVNLCCRLTVSLATGRPTTRPPSCLVIPLQARQKGGGSHNNKPDHWTTHRAAGVRSRGFRMCSAVQTYIQNPPAVSELLLTRGTSLLYKNIVSRHHFAWKSLVFLFLPSSPPPHTTIPPCLTLPLSCQRA